MMILYIIWPLVITLILTIIILASDSLASNAMGIAYTILVIGMVSQLAWVGYMGHEASEYTEVKTDRVDLTDEETNALLNNITIVVKYKGDEVKVNPAETGISFNSINSNYVSIRISKNKFDKEKQTMSIHLVKDKAKITGLQPRNTE